MTRALVCYAISLTLSACTASPSAHTDTRANVSAAPIDVPAGNDWTRFGWDAARSNASTDDTGITPANAGALERQQVTIEGIVDASPIYLSAATVNGAAHDVFFATTSYGKTIAIDADAGATLWTFTPDGYSSWAGSAQITNATPVADANRQFIYAASPDGHVQKLAVADGRAVWSTPITTRPDREKIASALNFVDGRVIATTGGYVGDAPPYQGHVVVLDGASGRIDHVWNSLCSDRPRLLDPQSCAESDSAIWGRAGAVIDPETGDILVATGNGRWDGKTFWGDAVVELDRDATRIVGSYTPANTDDLDQRDLDVGSTSPALLGGDLVLQGGKDGVLRLLGREAMRRAGAERGGEIQTVPTPSGGDLFTAPAVWHAGNTTWVFVADNSGTEALTLGASGLQEQWHNRNAGTSPVLAGGLLYVYDPGGGLRVYDPQTGASVATLASGGGHWNSPIVADGRIALPEGSANSHRLTGILDVWRVPGAPTQARRRR